MCYNISEKWEYKGNSTIIIGGMMCMTKKVAINGFGRIGRSSLRLALENPDLEIVAINDLTDAATLAHLVKYDSLYGTYSKTVEVTDNQIIIDGKAIKVFAEKDPAVLPWGKLGVDIVLECSGVFRTKEGASKHITAGAKKVVVSAPGKNLDGTFVMGVNEETYDPANHHVISNASCTTNCLAPVAKVLQQQFGIENGLMTTIHSYTNDQRILDGPHKDLRRSRAAMESIIPTTTGAAKAVALVLPELKGKLNGFALRVPTPTVSLVDLVVELQKNTTVEEVNEAFKAAAENELKGILGYSELPLVSIDYRGMNESSMVDGLSTMMMGDKMLKVVAWYDNEWGYCSRLVDLAAYVAQKM